MQGHCDLRLSFNTTIVRAVLPANGLYLVLMPLFSFFLTNNGPEWPCWGSINQKTSFPLPFGKKQARISFFDVYRMNARTGACSAPAKFLSVSIKNIEVIFCFNYLVWCHYVINNTVYMIMRSGGERTKKGEHGEREGHHDGRTETVWRGDVISYRRSLGGPYGLLWYLSGWS